MTPDSFSVGCGDRFGFFLDSNPTQPLHSNHANKNHRVLARRRQQNRYSSKSIRMPKNDMDDLKARLKKMDKIIKEAEEQAKTAKEATKAGDDLEAAANKLKKDLKDVPEE